MKLYVGNLPWEVDDTQLRALFATHGDVQSVRVMQDRETGRSRGFGFVEMNDEDANKAAGALNGYSVEGRPIVVNEARART